MESRIVEIRVKRPSQGFPLRKEYSRNRAGRTFTGGKLYMVVDEDTFESNDQEDLITEAQLAEVKGDPVFMVKDPYVAPVPGDEGKHLEPYLQLAGEIRERNAAGAIKPTEAPEWTRPKGPVLKQVKKPKFTPPPPPTPEEIAEAKEEMEARAETIHRKQGRAGRK